jgi:hypothetical protein
MDSMKIDRMDKKMGKSKSSDKEKGKGSQLVIRIDKAERSEFVSLCEELDTSAAREIRRFMREFVATHSAKIDAEKDSKPIKKNDAKIVVVEALPAEKPPSEVSPSVDAVEADVPKQPKRIRRQKPV